MGEGRFHQRQLQPKWVVTGLLLSADRVRAVLDGVSGCFGRVAELLSGFLVLVEYIPYMDVHGGKKYFRQRKGGFGKQVRRKERRQKITHPFSGSAHSFAYALANAADGVADCVLFRRRCVSRYFWSLFVLVFK
jgi:hypothetical protein